MELKTMLRLVVKYKYFIVISCVLTIIASSFISFRYIKDQYRTSAVMLISSLKNSQNDESLSNNDHTLSVNLVGSYRILCKTDYILNKVLEKTNLPLTAEQLSSKITVDSENNTEIITITAVDTDPNTAALIANYTAKVFESEIPTIMKMDNVKIIDEAPVPASPFSPNRKSILCLSLISCLVFCCSLIALLEHFDVTIKTEDQLETLLEVPVISSIPHTKFRLNK